MVDQYNVLVRREEMKKPGFTNNEGELLGVAYAAAICNPGDTIITDSMNTIRWMKKEKPKRGLTCRCSALLPLN